jgi:hypothetical protein
MTPLFQRNARGFRKHLSSIVTRTITHQGLALDFIKGDTEAYIYFHGDYARLQNGCTLRILQRIGPNPKVESKVTTLEYIYAFRIGSDPTREPFVRYEYVPELAAKSDYPYSKGHVHLSATAPDYDELIKLHEKKPLHQVHFPAGRISLEDFIQLLIVEFHVPTHSSRERALALLEESRRVFLEEKRTKD